MVIDDDGTDVDDADDVLQLAEIARMPFVMPLKQHCCTVLKAHH